MKPTGWARDLPSTALTTRLTEFFGIEYPILLAPMDVVSGGRLAAAVTAAGGLGLIGGGYGDAEWLRREYIDQNKLGIETGEGFYKYPNPAYRRADFLQPRATKD